LRYPVAQGEITSSFVSRSAARWALSHNLTMEMANIFGYDVGFCP